jgi:hypothetical protein
VIAICYKVGWSDEWKMRKIHWSQIKPFPFVGVVANQNICLVLVLGELVRFMQYLDQFCHQFHSNFIWKSFWNTETLSCS